MDTTKLKKFAQYARRYLIQQVTGKMQFVLATDSAARRENPKAVEELEKQIRGTSSERVIDKVAYIWFNRFCAIRFMDVNRYTRIGILSPAEGQLHPEILAEAKMGHVDDEMVTDPVRQKVFGLLGGSIPSPDPQTEAYHLLVVAACNYLSRTMPFMFEKIADYTELLVPDDLLSANSILAQVREALTTEDCRDVEVIGWLYQFYISEKKDEVFDGLKKNKKITPENIPAATQLFTPHWIVRYLVENSLGRLWMLNHPGSRLIGQMDYYIKPESPEDDFLKISRPEEIKLGDPACGSGHMLTHSYDLLYAIYEEEGYDTNEIPRLILENNLFGIEIDERAGELAAFALAMKAAKGNPKGDKSNRRRYFRNPVQPHICVLQNIHFEEDELKNYMDAIGRDLFTVNLQTMLHQFREADNFGSLIRPAYTDAATIEDIVTQKNVTYDLFLQKTHEKVLLALKQADYLSPKYHVVVANPPYMGSGGMNGRLAAWVKDNYPDSKADLFAAFIERDFNLAREYGQVAMITMQSWMFLASFEKFRNSMIEKKTIVSMAHLGERGFDSIGGAVVSTVCFVIQNNSNADYVGSYLRLVDGASEAEKDISIRKGKENPACGWAYQASASDFSMIPGSPIAYWASERVRRCFKEMRMLCDVGKATLGMNSTNNDLFTRQWFEVGYESIDFDVENEETSARNRKKWFPYNKGGDFRKWYGNRDAVINWKNNGLDIHDYNHIPLSYRGAPVRSKQYQFKESATWSFVSSSKFGVRYSPPGSMFDVAGSSYFAKEVPIKEVVGFLCSKVAFQMLNILNPTLNFQVGNIASLPVSDNLPSNLSSVVDQLVELSKLDWGSHEISWDFEGFPLIDIHSHQFALEESYARLRSNWRNRTLQMRCLEQENNQIFLEAYSLQDELVPDVPLDEITLTYNPHYRYGNKKSESELEALLLTDTMKEFISYAVGCMFGRYSLDKPGLILSNQGETIEDYLSKVQKPTFLPDSDNVIPILDEGWFAEDITEKFRRFLKVTFGEEHYDENISFIEEAIGKDIRKYFLKDFYNDHVKRYKKRPIYWLFSSPRGSFNALIYMHRYGQDTVSIVLNDYLREFRAKLSARKEHLEQMSINTAVSVREKTQALKDLEKLRKVMDELDEYERDILYPLATKQISIDLDDGVKENYPKLGSALKRIAGLDEE